MSRFLSFAVILASLISCLLFSSPASAATPGLTIADVQAACAPVCSLADFTESGGQVVYRLENRYAEKSCLTFTFNYAIIEFRVFLPLGRQRSGQVYPGQVARIDNVCAGIFSFRWFNTIPGEIVTAQKLCRPVARCSVDHFTLHASEGLVQYDHELDGKCPGFTIVPGMFFDRGGARDYAPYRYIETCNQWVGGTPVLPAFPDLAPSSVEGQAVTDLMLRDIVRGNQDGTFGASNPVLRAQMAALVARSLNVDLEDHGANSMFHDQGAVDNVLWGNVGTLAYLGILHGYGDGTFQPTGQVLRAQVISFIARAMVKTGCWTPAPDANRIYPNVPDTSGHRLDIATYSGHAGVLSLDGNPFHEFVGWDQPATRGWVAVKLALALNSVCK